MPRLDGIFYFDFHLKILQEWARDSQFLFCNDSREPHTETTWENEVIVRINRLLRLGGVSEEHFKLRWTTHSWRYSMSNFVSTELRLEPQIQACILQHFSSKSSYSLTGALYALNNGECLSFWEALKNFSEKHTDTKNFYSDANVQWADLYAKHVRKKGVQN